MPAPGQGGRVATRPAQRPAQSSAQKPQTAAKRTTRKLAIGPGGKPVPVFHYEVDAPPPKKTVWSRVKSGTKKTGKAVKKLSPHATKSGKDSSGFNLSYYRKSFFLLDQQKQYNLYCSGFAPKMTKSEVTKLENSGRRVTKKYPPDETVMYDAHISPDGFEAPIKDLKAEAEEAKRDAREAAARKKKKKRKLKQAAAAANPDALPAHPTPAHYTKIQVQSRPSKIQQQQRLQRQQRLKQQQQQRLAQAATSKGKAPAPTRPSSAAAPPPPQQRQQRQQHQQQQPRPQPQRQPQPQSTATATPAQRRPRPQEEQPQERTAASHAQSQGLRQNQSQSQSQSQSKGLEQRPGQARARQSVAVPAATGSEGGGRRRVAGQSVASSSRG